MATHKPGDDGIREGDPVSSCLPSVSRPHSQHDAIHEGEPPVKPQSAATTTTRVRTTGSVRIVGWSLVAVVSVLALTALFVWPKYLRPIPHHGVGLSGNLGYILSESHLDSIQIGMTLDEVQLALDVAEEKCPLDPWITNVAEAQRIQRKFAQDNVRLFETARKGLPVSGEVWFDLSGPGQHAMSLKMRDGKVVEKVVHWNDFLQNKREGQP